MSTAESALHAFVRVQLTLGRKEPFLFKKATDFVLEPRMRIIIAMRLIYG